MKKLLALLTVLSLSVSLVGCSSGVKPADPSDPGPPKNIGGKTPEKGGTEPGK